MKQTIRNTLPVQQLSIPLLSCSLGSPPSQVLSYGQSRSSTSGSWRRNAPSCPVALSLPVTTVITLIASAMAVSRSGGLNKDGTCSIVPGDHRYYVSVIRSVSTYILTDQWISGTKDLEETDSSILDQRHPCLACQFIYGQTTWYPNQIPKIKYVAKT